MQRGISAAEPHDPLLLLRRRIRDHEWVSQRVWIEHGKIIARNRPRPEKDRGAVSVIVGRLTPAEVFALVRRDPRLRPSKEDGVRYAKVVDLRQAGFIVEHAPSQRIPGHVRVTLSTVWDDHAAARFDKCFTEPVWHDDMRRA